MIGGARGDAAWLAVAGVSLVVAPVSFWFCVPAALASFVAGRRTARAGPAALILVLLVALGLLVAAFLPGQVVYGSRLLAVVAFAAMFPWFVGRFWRQSQELVRAGWARAEQLEREQLLIAEQTRLRERARIAQDMHDSLGHELSLIALRAGALKVSPRLDDRDRAAAGELRASAADAVDRLGEVIGLLRDEHDEPAERTGVAELVDRARRSGLDVTLLGDDGSAGAPPLVQRAAYRVVQEALTNVAKHAPGAAATVRVDGTPTETRVEVANGPGQAAAAGPAGGRGIIGLQERVRLLGGDFAHGPRGDGFAVVARLPHRGAPSPTPVAAAPPSSPVPQLPRRMGRSLVVALLAPVLTFAALIGTVQAWQLWVAARAVLDPADFARLRVGQDRAEIESLLPGRQTPLRPRVAEPADAGMSCEYYAITANPMDDRSGDAYRLCFRGGTLVHLDVLTS